MIDLETANALIDADDNRHRRKGKATVYIGVTYPFKRYIWLHRIGSGLVEVTLFGNLIASIMPNGVLVDDCGYPTPTTREALNTVLGPLAAQTVTPGSRGGEKGEHKTLIYGEPIPRGGLFVPRKAAA